jgi:hypothetical protein
MIFNNHYIFIYILKPLILSSFTQVQKYIYIFLEYSNHIKILIFSKNELEIIELVNDNLYLST